jgi:hypothetical protein
MPDLHDWITQRITKTEATARACTATDWRHVFDGIIVDRDTDGWQSAPDNARIASVAYERIYWSTSPPHSPDADHIVTHDPDTVLRRCEADRRILARHRIDPSNYYEPACHGCGTYGYADLANVDNLNECPELLDLAHAHGITPEILAGLDQPQTPARPERTDGGRGFQMPAALQEAMARLAMTSVPPALRGPNWKA